MDIITLTVGPLATNCYLVAASGEAVVIDPGGDPEKVLAALAEKHWKLKCVLLSHAHFDHINGAAGVIQVTGVPLAIHPLDLPLLRSGGGARAWGFEADPCPEPDQLLEPGQKIEFGSARLEVLHVPGHTPGHIAFYSVESKALFGGDVLFRDGIGRTDLPGGDPTALLHSIHTVLFALPDATIVYPGHGPATHIGRERRENPFLAPDMV